MPSDLVDAIRFWADVTEPRCWICGTPMPTVPEWSLLYGWVTWWCQKCEIGVGGFVTPGQRSSKFSARNPSPA